MYGLIILVALFQTGLGTGRTIPTVAAAAGLGGVIIAGLALARPAMRSLGAKVAIALSLISLLVGGLHAAYAAGSFGTGNGLAGAVVAVALGLVGLFLGGLAIVRSRQTV